MSVPTVTVYVCDRGIHIKFNSNSQDVFCRTSKNTLTRDEIITLIRALVISKVDYHNSISAGVSRFLLSRLQSILNAAACFIFAARKSDRITPLLKDLHRLKATEELYSSYVCWRIAAFTVLPPHLLPSLYNCHTVLKDIDVMQYSQQSFLSGCGRWGLEHFTIFKSLCVL